MEKQTEKTLLKEEDLLVMEVGVVVVKEMRFLITPPNHFTRVAVSQFHRWDR